MKFPSRYLLYLFLIERFCEFTSQSLAIIQPAFGNVFSLALTARNDVIDILTREGHVRIWKIRHYGPGCNLV